MPIFNRSFALGLCLVGIVGSHPVFAEETQQADATSKVMTIIDKMKAIFEPTTPRVATVTITFPGESSEKVQWAGRLARATIEKEKHTLLVMLEPQDIKATAFLVEERQDAVDHMWLYLPPIDRIRQILPVETYQQFLGTDFTYADFGFVDRRGQYRLLGEEQHNGKRTYKIELAPTDPWYYSCILTWVDAESYLPLQHDFFDVATKPWRVQTFDKVTIIDDHPTPLCVEMKDLQQGTSTIITISEIEYNANFPESLFNPKHLRVAAGQTR